MRCQGVVRVWDKNISSWIFVVKQYEETMANEQSQNGRREYQIDEITYAKKGGGGYCLKPKLWTSQIWTLINNFVIVLAYAKCSKLITLKENLISVQQLPLCLPMFFAFSSEVLHSGIKSCFDWVVLQDQLVKNVLYVFGFFSISFCYCFYEGFIHKIILVSRFLPFICISYPL